MKEQNDPVSNIGIFRGRQRDYNLQVLTILFDNGPLSAWGITKLMKAPIEKHSLHPTINKRLRSLGKLGYVRRNNTVWLLPLKGVIATLLTQTKPREWNPKWNELFKTNAKQLNNAFDKMKIRIVSGEEEITPQEMLDFSGNMLTTFNAWVGLSKVVKKLIELGWDLDRVTEKQLFRMIVLETAHFDEFWPPDNP